MENALLNEQVLGTDPILKVTALLYLKEALVNQQYEACQELVKAAKDFGADGNDIKAVIAEYLAAASPGNKKANHRFL